MKIQMILRRVTTLIGLFIFIISCKQNVNRGAKNNSINTVDDSIQTSGLLRQMPSDLNIPSGMVWIPGREFKQGAVSQDDMAMSHEKPAFKVAVDGFFMDETEVTNAKFKKFVDETDYISIAEREIDWEEMKIQLPANTPKPHDSIMQPGALTFRKSKTSVSNLFDFSQWWKWTIGANWKHPNGPGSSINGKGNEPVVQIAYEDAIAYCEWAGRRLPTEAEWEWASRGGKKSTIYFWGDSLDTLAKMANTWEGEFPVNNTLEDGFELRAPVKTFPANGFGLYDMAGNVWEWTSDWYNTKYYNDMAQKGTTSINPTGASTPFNDRDPFAKEKVIKGGSFLCSASYCASYRISARMASSLDSSLEHLGFRTVATAEMIEKENKSNK